MVKFCIVTYSIFVIALVGASTVLAESVDQEGQVGLALRHQETRSAKVSNAERIDILLQTAAIHRTSGSVQESFTALAQARALASSGNDGARLALILGGLSDAYLLSRHGEEALSHAKESVDIARQTGVPVVLATTLNHLGNALMVDQYYSDAVAAYYEALEFADQSKDHALAVKLLINAIHVHLEGDTKQQAIRMINAALTRAHALPNSLDKIYSLVALGYQAQRVYLSGVEDTNLLTQSAYSAFREAEDIAESLGDARAKSYAIGHLGELYTTVRQSDDAERLLQQALFFAAESDAPELLARWHWQLGRTFRTRGTVDQAIEAYREAIEQLELIQPALVFGQRGDLKYFRETIRAIYLELADILLNKARAASDDQQKGEIFREVRNVMEEFKGAELKNYFQDSCVTERRAKNASLDVDTLITPGVATLYPIVFADRIVLLLSLSNAVIKEIEVPVGRAELTETVATFRQHLSRSGNPRRVRRDGLTLYNWLIRPIEEDLKTKGVDTLVVVPDDVLRTIPFSALHDGEDFLVRRYAFAITPGLTLTNPKRFGSRKHRVLLNGLSVGVQGFEPLPHVANEIQRIATFYDSTVLVDDDFKKNSVLAQLERTPYTAVLFATHAQFHSDSSQSFLLTYDDKVRLDELDRYIRVSEFRDEQVEILVLSACQTAEGDERAALGLAGVAVKAGASSVVASLWSVNDASTAELVPTFFHNLNNSALSRAQALQAAQLRLLADDRYDHPFHWASFVLIGNWF